MVKYLDLFHFYEMKINCGLPLMFPRSKHSLILITAKLIISMGNEHKKKLIKSLSKKTCLSSTIFVSHLLSLSLLHSIRLIRLIKAKIGRKIRTNHNEKNFFWVPFFSVVPLKTWPFFCGLINLFETAINLRCFYSFFWVHFSY
jgi:hypothetical protein